MKLKLLNLFFIILLLLSKIECSPKQCKTEILRGHGLHSRITPNRNNSLCPAVGLNCCTVHDQMKIHKIWTDVSKPTLDNYYKMSMQNLTDFIGKVLGEKDQIDMKTLILKFEKETPKPAVELIKHLKDLQKIFEKKSGKFYKDLTKAATVRFTGLYKKIHRLRKSFYCGLCDWHNLDHISDETQVIFYDVKFCKRFIKENIDAWSMKYVDMINMALIMDEFIYLISNFRLIKEQSDRAIMHKYKVLIKKCEADQSDKISCPQLCQEFNINRFNYLIDGEQDFFKSYMVEFKKILEIVADPKKHHLLFENRRMSFMTFDYKKFKDQTVLQDNLLETGKKDPKKKKKNENPLAGLILHANKNFIEKTHPANTLQEETLDDQVDTYLLYRMIEEPVDISLFAVVVQEGWGYNPYNDAKSLNLDEPTQKFLALIHSGGKNAHALDEILEVSVEDVLLRLELTDMSDFVNDSSLIFNKIVKSNIMEKLKAMKEAHAKKKAAAQAQARMLAGSPLTLVGNCLLLVLMVFVSY